MGWLGESVWFGYAFFAMSSVALGWKLGPVLGLFAPLLGERKLYAGFRFPEVVAETIAGAV